MTVLLRQCHQSVEVVVGWRHLLALNVHMLYDDTVTRRVWAAEKALSHRCLAVRFFNQKLGEGHPDRKPRWTVVLERNADAEWTPQTDSCLPCICIASYQGKFQLGAPVTVLCSLRVACQKRRWHSNIGIKHIIHLSWPYSKIVLKDLNEEWIFCCYCMQVSK